MAAMSAAPAGTALTPPSSSHGPGYSWSATSGHAENIRPDKKTSGPNDGANTFTRTPLIPQNGNAGTFLGGGDSAPEMKRTTSQEASYLSPPYRKDTKPGSIKDTNSPADSLLDLYGTSKGDKRTNTEIHGDGSDDENSKWIHRDKLARIESEELQAAGIILPAARARSRPRREQSHDKVNGQRKTSDNQEPAPTRSRKNSTVGEEPMTPEAITPSWDLRLPDEIASDPPSYFVSSGGVNGSSRIPVAKLSPLPIPHDYIERDTPTVRKRETSPGEDDSITYPKIRTRSRSGSAGAKSALDTAGNGAPILPAKRSATDVSPKKGTGAAAGRKGSGPAKAAGANGRPRTRGGPSKDSTSSSGGQTRPSTRSGELSPSTSNKQPEGEPPWMVSAYRPDPRLPPDQQLLPTVARRLQQEKWEREGKFGSVYDKEFRPLTDEGLPEPPPAEEPRVELQKEREIEKPDEWPLKTDTRSPGLSPALSPGLVTGRTGSYSTIPKIQDKPNSPLPSPRFPMQQNRPSSPLVRVPDLPEEQEPKKKGCACCIVM